MTHRVLIVDDEPNIVLALEFLMQKEGYEVRTAEDGEIALQEMLSFKPDLLILDVMMPKIDGFEVCQRVRTEQANRNVIILMLTAKGREVESEKGLQMGADLYVTKPFSTRELVQKVKEILTQKRQS